MFIILCVIENNTMLGTFSIVFECDKKHALLSVAECPAGRSGTLRTTRQGKSPVESGAAVFADGLSPDVGASVDTEAGSPVRNKRGASSPERRRAG